MIRYARLALACAFVAAAAMPLRAEEAVAVPAYAPAAGSVWQVHAVTDLKTVFDGSGTVPADTRADRLDLTHRQQIVEKSGELWHEVWTLDVDGASVRVPPMNEEPANPHEAYRRSLAMWGVTALEIETDGAGAPQRLAKADVIRAGVEKTMRALVGPNAPTPLPILTAFDARPEMLIDMVLPEIRALAALQTPTPRTVAVGATWTRDGTDVIAGVSLNKKTVFVVEAADAGTVGITWRDVFEPEALTRGFAALIEQNLAVVKARSGEPSAERRKALSEVAIDNHGKVVLSLVDGVARSAEFTRLGRFGDLTTSVEARIDRRPQ